jgi:HSP20 family molecular chaperone IbpA
MRQPPEFKVARTEAGLEISVKIDPCSKDQFRITIEGGGLRIYTESDGFSLLDKVVQLPAGYDLTRATADCRQGMLRITVPKPFRWN